MGTFGSGKQQDIGQKMENRRAEQVLPRGLVPVWWGGRGDRVSRVNMMPTLCTHVCNGKRIPVETTPGMER
jgi:hypothetical protein